MLVLGREKSQTVVITVPPSTEPQTIKITMVGIRNGVRARLGFDAKKAIEINRGEIQKRVDAETQP
jgi:sRNA-binding carbon storage regulator CsrA